MQMRGLALRGGMKRRISIVAVGRIELAAKVQERTGTGRETHNAAVPMAQRLRHGKAALITRVYPRHAKPLRCYEKFQLAPAESLIRQLSLLGIGIRR